jgi:glyoxylase-like metal-dependent hydrolase (beta-lactamase superfamily II)
MTSQPDLLEIAPGLHRLRIPGDGAHLLNSYLWLGPDAVALFDAGWADSAPLIEAALRALGRRPDDVSHLVLSHFHEDHAGAAAEIAGWPHVAVVAGALEADTVRGREAGALPSLTPGERAIHEQPTQPPRARASRVDLEVSDGDVLPIAGQARVIHTPGHTPGSTSFVVEGSPVLLSGDTLFPGGPGATRWPYSDFEVIIASIDTRLFPLPANTVVMPGHGADTTIGAERPHLREWAERGW